jgi:hypothetical protein
MMNLQTAPTGDRWQVQWRIQRSLERRAWSLSEVVELLQFTGQVPTTTTASSAGAA